MNRAPPVPPIWTTGSTEVCRTGTWRAALPVYGGRLAPCQDACPVHGEIAGWIRQALTGDYRGAWDTLTINNPFPAVTGRICHHPCESACNRGRWDAPVSICRLERYVGDLALADGWAYAPPPARPGARRTAIVGGGPAGLAAAYQLRRRGHAVTLFEARDRLGGLLRYGIPAYRLPRPVLDAEIDRILALGVEVRTATALHGAQDFARLRGEYDAVFLAMGAARPKRVPQLDYAQPWVREGADWLARANDGAIPALGRRLVVIGGGSAALDVARSARRAGHAVTVLALEREDAMPAQREEVIEAREEDVRLVTGAMLTAIERQADGALTLRCIEVACEPGTRAGQLTVTPIAGTGFTLGADAIVAAIGQDPDLDALGGFVPGAGPLLPVDAGYATATAGVYAGGDLTSMARYVTEAIGMGRRAADRIDRDLERAPASAAVADAPLVPIAAINTVYHERTARAPALRHAPEARIGSFEEVAAGFDAREARAEAGRCFSCGQCIFCDNCYYYCPDLAIRRRDGGYDVLGDYCKGCGLCARECPTGTITMQDERR